MYSTVATSYLQIPLHQQLPQMPMSHTLHLPRTCPQSGLLKRRKKAGDKNLSRIRIQAHNTAETQGSAVEKPAERVTCSTVRTHTLMLGPKQYVLLQIAPDPLHLHDVDLRCSLSTTGRTSRYDTSYRVKGAHLNTPILAITSIDTWYQSIWQTPISR